MKERPILFSAPMVNAILDGRKTQTRRIVKPQPETWGNGGLQWAPKRKGALGGWAAGADFIENGKLDENTMRLWAVSCPYGKVGDRLWVRETWQYDGFGMTSYRATSNSPDKLKWKPSIHMPRWASRITLEITDIRVERLNDISDVDAEAEGLEKYKQLFKDYSKKDNWYGSAVNSFWTLWESINGKDSWQQNPWVWVVEFKRIEK